MACFIILVETNIGAIIKFYRHIIFHSGK